MSSGSKSQTVGYKYFLGVHAGLVRGCIDFIARVRFDKRTGWTGRASGGEQIVVDSPGLFGGEAREGGVSGVIDVLDGSADQAPNSYLSSLLGTLIPSFRGFSSAVFRQFYWGNNPYLGSRSPMFLTQRIYKRGDDGKPQWYGDKAEVLQDFGQLIKVGTESEVQVGSGRISIARLSTNLISVSVAAASSGNWIRAFSFGAGAWSQVGLSFNLGTESFPASCRLSENIIAFWGTRRRLRIYEWKDDQFNQLASLNPVGPPSDSFPVYLARLSDSDFAFWHNASSERKVRAFRFTGSSIVPLGDAFTVPIYSAANDLVEFSSNREVLLWQDTSSGIPWTVLRHDESGGWGIVSSVTGSRTMADSYHKLPGPYIAGRKGRAMVLIDIIKETEETWSFQLAKTFPDQLVADDSTCDICDLSNGVLATLSHSTMRLEAVSYGLPTGDMNPAHIIRELFTEAYGMAYPESELDEAAFTKAADTLHAEGMGMSWLWDRESSAGDAMDEVLRHIDGVRYSDPETGLFVIRLVRADYDAEGLPILNKTNVERVEGFSRQSQNELVNSVTVKYLSAETNEEAAVSVTDPALVMQQGHVTHETLTYHGFTKRDIAGRVAERDLRALSRPLASCTVYTGSNGASLRPGDPVVLDWPDYGLNETVMRVTEVSYGDGKTTRVRIQCVEDSFSTPLTSVVVPEAVVYEDPITQPPLPAAHRLAAEAPYYELVRSAGQRQTDEELAYDPLEGWLLVAAARPGSAVNATLAVDSGAGYQDVGAPLDFCPKAVLTADVSAHVTEFPIGDGQELDLVAVGSIVQIGEELCRVDSITDALLTVGRGILDTIPTAHLVGDVLLFWGEYTALDSTTYTSGEIVSVKLLTATGAGVLSFGSAPVDQVTFAQRALRPYPPGNVSANGEPFGAFLSDDTTITFTWTHRDRLQQTGGAHLDHTDASIGPESGTTYTIEVVDALDATVRTFSGITGVTQEYTLAQIEADILSNGLPLTVRLYSVRSSLSSLHAYTWHLGNGWGANWNKSWGTIG